MPTLGLLMLETRFPRPPGDIGYSATFGFPVLRRMVRGASPARVVRGRNPAVLAPFVAAAKALLDDGACAIATSCGFVARWQRVMQAALPVPVRTSALLALADADLEVVAAGLRLLAREPATDTLVLECTNLPPYADALRAATGRPVHDVTTLLNARMAALGTTA